MYKGRLPVDVTLLSEKIALVQEYFNETGGGIIKYIIWYGVLLFLKMV